jgi:uncharacterized protein YneF (UPF0154 family)
MSEITEETPFTHTQKKFLEDQKEFTMPFRVFLGFFFLLNLVSGVAPSIPNVIIGIIIYRGLSKRLAAKTILKHPSLSNGALYRKSVLDFTWKTFLAFFLVPAIAVTFIEPATRKGEALGLYFAYFVFCYILSVDRAFWLIKKFRSIATEPLKIKTATGLSTNQKILRNGLIVLTVLFGIIFLGAFFKKTKVVNELKPLPPTRTEEMQQRVVANTQRTGDARAQEVVEQNIEKYKSLEEAVNQLVAATGKANADVIFEPHKSTLEKISQEKKILKEIQECALRVNEELIDFEETTKLAISKKFKDSPETIRSAMEKAQTGKVLFEKWTRDAIQLSQACTRHLDFFQATGKIDQALEITAAQSAVKYEEAAKKLDERIQSNFEKMETTIPR